MNQKALKNLIKKFLQEYTGTGDSGGNAGDGNIGVSPRVGGSFHNDEDEMLDYLHKNVGYGAMGNHTNGMEKHKGSVNRDRRGGMFEETIDEESIEQLTQDITYLQNKIQNKTFKITDKGIENALSQAAIAGNTASEPIEQARINKATAYKELNDIEHEITVLKTRYDSLLKQETTQAIIDQRKELFKQMSELEAKLPGLEDTFSAAIKSEDDAIAAKAKQSGDSHKNITQMKKQAYDAKKQAKKAAAKSKQSVGVQEQAYGSATLTSQGQGKSRFTKTGMPPGVWEQEDEPIDPDYKGPSYDEVILVPKLVGFKDAYEYDNDKHQLIIYPDLGQNSYKSRSTQEIVFRLERGELHFVRAFGMERTYQELKNVFPELPEMRDSSYSGFMNVGEESIPVDLDTAHKMIQALNIGREGESAAQSAHYSREPGRGGTGIDEAEKKHLTLLIKQYTNERQGNNLMAFMDRYEKKVIKESAIQKIFREFDNGGTNEEVLRNYAKKGISVPEPFLTKLRKQYESLKKAKLELEFSEQEAKDFKRLEIEKPEEPKKIASRLFREAKIIKKYPLPQNIKDALENTLKMYPLKRFVKSLKAINSIPPSYRIFLNNSQSFDIIDEKFSLRVKVKGKKYYLGDIDEKNYATKAINSLLIDPIVTKDEEEPIEEPPIEEPIA